jgi:hypothetical protein
MQPTVESGECLIRIEQKHALCRPFGEWAAQRAILKPQCLLQGAQEAFRGRFGISAIQVEGNTTGIRGELGIRTQQRSFADSTWTVDIQHDKRRCLLQQRVPKDRKLGFTPHKATLTCCHEPVSQAAWAGRGCWHRKPLLKCKLVQTSAR